MAIIGNPRASWSGNTTYLLSGLNVQAGDAVVSMFATSPAFNEADLLNGWGLIGRFTATGTTWFDEDCNYVVVAKRFTATELIPETVVTQKANRSAVKGTAPWDAVSWQFRGIGSLAFNSWQSNNTYATLPEIAVNGTGAIDAVYGQAITEGTNVFLEDTDANGVKTYAKSFLRQTTGADALKSRGVVKKVSVTWLDGTVETKTYPNQYIYVSQFSLGSLAAVSKPTSVWRNTSAWVDVTKPWTLNWVYQPRLTGAMTGWALRRTSASAVSYWDNLAKLWVGSEVINAGAANSTTIVAASSNTTESTISLALKVVGTTAGSTGDYGTAFVANVASKPTATALIEQGTATSDTSLRITPAGSIVTAVPNTVVTGWSGEVVGADGVVVASYAGSALLPWVVAIPSSGTYTVRVRVSQTGGGLSDWFEQAVTVTSPTPSTPVVASVSHSHAVSGVPGIRLTTTFPWAAQPFAWGDKRVRLRVQRAASGSSDWTTVGLLGPYTGKTYFHLNDYSAPSGTAVIYRVRGESLTRAGTWDAGAWSAPTAPIVMNIDCGWIVDVYRPELAVKVTLAEESSRNWATGNEPVYPIGHTYATVPQGNSRAFTSTLKVRVAGESEESRVVSLTTNSARLLVRWHREENARTGIEEAPRDLWMTATGEIQVSRNRPGPTASREIDIPYVAQLPYSVEG